MIIISKLLLFYENFKKQSIYLVNLLVFLRKEGYISIHGSAKNTDNIRMNSRTGILSFWLCAVILTAPFFPQGLYGEEGIHTVRKGETLYSIARTLGISADDLMKLNGITAPSRLQEGQRLKVPVKAGQSQPAAPPAQPRAQPAASGPAQAQPAAAGGFVTYRVVRGDTFYSLARRFSVTEGMIREANRLSASYSLREGDSLRIPQAGAANPAPSEAPRPAAPSVSWPVSAREVSYMTGKLSGVAITGTRTESVKSLTQGTVLSAGPYRGRGRVAIIQVEGGYLYVYGGCESLSVKEGDRVGPGTEVGKLGIDPKLNKPQLFFMVFRNNLPVDPAKAPRA
jgi:murein DD-endopeptidase MepM/ murein hydrolase activator NlpD